MSWFRIDDSFWAHRKARQAGLEAVGLWAACGAYASSSACDDTGLLTENDVQFVANALGTKNWKRLAQRLVAVGLWHSHREGFVFHDWDDYRNGGEAELSRRRERDADRKRRAREKRDVLGLSADKSEDVPRKLSAPPDLPVLPVLSIPAAPRTGNVDTAPDPELATTFAAALRDAGHTVAVGPFAWKELSLACRAYWPAATGRERHDLLAAAVKRWAADNDGDSSWGWNHKKFVEWANKGNASPPPVSRPKTPEPMGELVEVSTEELAAMMGGVVTTFERKSNAS